MQISLCGDSSIRELSEMLLGMQIATDCFFDRQSLYDAIVMHHPMDLAVVTFDGALGRNVCAQIRGSYPKVQILWFTDQKDFEAESREIPVDEFYVKPFPISWICQAIRRKLE